MGIERVRIGLLELSAPAREPLARMLPEVQDALRIASWPGGSGGLCGLDGLGGVVQIALIDLGVIAPGTSRQALAQRIAVLARGAAPIAASAARPVPQATALHWPDRVELLAAVALQIGNATALPWWADQALSAAPPGPAPQRLAVAAEQMAQVSGGEALAALVLRIAVLGEADACLSALAAALPTAGERRFPALMRRVVPKLARPLRPPPIPVSSPGPVAVPAPPLPLPTADLLPALVNRLSRPQAMTVATLIRRAALPPAALAALVLLALSGRHGPGAVAEVVRQGFELTPPLAPMPHVRPAPVPDAPRPRPRGARSGATGTAPKPRAVPLPDPPPVPLPEGRTRLGGLPMLVNLLRLAGTEAMDNGLNAGFSLRLIHAVLARAGHDPAAPDPLIAALPAPLDLELSPPRRPTPALPGAWLMALAPAVLALARVPGLPGLRAVLLPGGRGCLGLVDAAGLRQLRRDKQLRRGPPLAREAFGAALLGGWQILLARGFRALTGDSWRRTIRRDGYLATSTTHIDITLDLDAIRLPERRAGLDRSPGWVPLLSRVVTLHYERFRKADHGREGVADAQ